MEQVQLLPPCLTIDLRPTPSARLSRNVMPILASSARKCYKRCQALVICFWDERKKTSERLFWLRGLLTFCP